jgi:hypothetical protein
VYGSHTDGARNNASSNRVQYQHKQLTAKQKTTKKRETQTPIGGLGVEMPSHYRYQLMEYTKFVSGSHSGKNEDDL